MYLLKRSKAKKDVAEANLEPQTHSDASLDLEASLHQPAEDNSSVASFTSLRGYIESHTLEFYHSEPVHIDVAELKIKLEEILPSVPVANLEMLARTLIHPEASPFAIRSLKEKRVENISQIVARTAKIGNILFGQPSIWRFRWNVTPSDHRRQEKLSEEGNTKVMTKPSVVVYPAIEKIGDVDGIELVKPILKEEAEIFFLMTFSNLSSESEVKRKGSLNDNDLTHSKSTVPTPIAHDRALPGYSSSPERLQSKTVLENAPALARLPFEGQQAPLGPQAAHAGTTEPQSRRNVSDLDVVGPLPPQGGKIEGSRRIRNLRQSLRTVGTTFGGLPGIGTKKGVTGAAQFPTKTPSTPGTGKSLPTLPDSQEQQEIRIIPGRVEDQPSIDTDLNGSDDVSQFATQNMEAG